MKDGPAEMLMAKFYERKTRNPGYTLRAFSRDLSVSSGTLSELLSKKRTLTTNKARIFADRLFRDPAEKSLFLNLASAGSIPKPARNSSIEKFQTLSNDSFQVIADWQHYAIISLVETKYFKPTAQHIADRLGLSVKIAEESLDRLIRTGLLKWKGKSLVRSEQQLSTEFDHVSTALQHSHRQSLEQAVDCIERYGVKDREFISCTLAFDPEDMELAKTAIRKFAMSFKTQLPRRQKSEVFNMNIQLVPVTVIKESK